MFEVFGFLFEYGVFFGVVEDFLVEIGCIERVVILFDVGIGEDLENGFGFGEFGGGESVVFSGGLLVGVEDVVDVV